MKKVVIVGAGPCGVLLAHYLSRRSTEYKIAIYERRGDPRQVALSNSRTIPYGLSERGIQALRKIEGLEAAVKAKCVENYGLIVHQKNGKVQTLPKKSPSFNTDRISLIITLLSQLSENSDKSQVEIHFNSRCTDIDFDTRTVTFEQVREAASGKETEKLTVDYDILVGTDGARSLVRTHFLNTEFFEFEQQYVQSGYKTVFLPSKNQNIDVISKSNLKPNHLHVWRIKEGVNFGMVPQPHDKFIGVLFFLRNESKVVDFTSKEEVMAFFQENIPEAGQLLSEQEAEAFLKRPTATQLKIRCNRYHCGDNVLIMGDAAHAVSSSLGQGCNNAFEDVMILDSLLNEYADDWATAIQQFTTRRLPDAYALWELDTNVFPTSKILFTEFILRESFAKVMNKLLPQFFVPPLRELLSTSTLPYANILKLYRGWISKVKNSNAKFLSP